MGGFDFNVEVLSLLSLQKICASRPELSRRRLDMNYYAGIDMFAMLVLFLLFFFRCLLLSARRASPIWACSYVAFG